MVRAGSIRSVRLAGRDARIRDAVDVLTATGSLGALGARDQAGVKQGAEVIVARSNGEIKGGGQIGCSKFTLRVRGVNCLLKMRRRIHQADRIT